jgi:hypothetical protein
MLDGMEWWCGVDHVSREFGEERLGLGVCLSSTMGETKFALYLGAVLSTLLRVFTYIFLRVVSISLFLSLGALSDWLFL